MDNNKYAHPSICFLALIQFWVKGGWSLAELIFRGYWWINRCRNIKKILLIITNTVNSEQLWRKPYIG